MKLFDIIKRSFAKKLDQETVEEPKNGIGPLEANVGSLVTFLDVDVNLFRFNGSIATFPRQTSAISLITESKMLNVTVFNYYIGDDHCIEAIQTQKGLELKLWCHRDTILPQSTEDWSTWLGRYEKQDDGTSVLIEHGLIGWPTFCIDDLNITYTRNWYSGDEPREPVEYITHTVNNSINIKSYAMEYKRQLTEDMNEYLQVHTTVTSTNASVNIWIGLDLDPSSITILNS